MASMVGNPTGATSAERLTGGKEAPGGYQRALGRPGGGARRAAQEGRVKETYQSARQQAVANVLAKQKVAASIQR